MAGIKINESASWLVASWVHDFTVELFLKHLAVDAPEELKKILLYDKETHLGFFSVKKLDAKSLLALRNALDKIMDALNSGEEQFGTPDMLPNYLDRLRELREAIANDHRLLAG